MAAGSSIPKSWIQAPLEKVCEILDFMRIPINASERAKRIEEKQSAELYPYYGATGQVGVIDGYLFDGEHVLIGEDGAPFLDPFKDTAYLVRGRFWVNNHAHILKSHISNKYLCFYLNQIDYSRHVTGTTRLKLNQAALKQILTYLAPENEQRRIVAKIEELFSELDKGVESLKTARKQLKVYRQAVLKHAFEGNLTAQWREENKEKLETADQLFARIRSERETRYQQQLEEWKAALIGWDAKGKPGKKPGKPKLPHDIGPPNENESANLTKLPHGWAWVEIGNLCDVVRGGSPRPAGDKKYYDGNIPFLKVADLTRKPGAYLNTFSYTIKVAGLQKTRLVGPNTLMISNSGATLGVPKVCLIDATFNDGIAAFLGLNEAELLYHYYFWLSKTAALRGINQGAAQPNLNTDLLREIPIPVCSLAETQFVAQEVEKALSVCDQLLQEIEDGLSRCTALRQSILKRAFSGQLVAQDPNDEPASELLERIRVEKAASADKPRYKARRKGPSGVER